MPVVGWEGSYEVSNHGRVRSVDRTIIGKDGIAQRHRGVLLAQTEINSGYLAVHLREPGVSRRLLVHRAVAEAFLRNPDNYDYVNHKDENRKNNRVENLEWCTAIYNANYGHAKERLSKSHINHPSFSKKVVMMTRDGVRLQVFSSVNEASRVTGISSPQISRCCRGEHYLAGSAVRKWPPL